jgi:hypothetical protein
LVFHGFILVGWVNKKNIFHESLLVGWVNKKIVFMNPYWLAESTKRSFSWTPIGRLGSIKINCFSHTRPEEPEVPAAEQQQPDEP